jgi:hypothetical protein
MGKKDDEKDMAMFWRRPKKNKKAGNKRQATFVSSIAFP